MRFKTKLGIVSLTLMISFSNYIGAKQNEFIEDCETFAEQVTTLVNNKLTQTKKMDGNDVNQLMPQYPNVTKNHIQMYISSSALNWIFTNGNIDIVYAKTLETCRIRH